jgi:molybdenum cofactor cytidylyltransferase
MGTPKALLKYHGETFLDRLIGIFGRSCAGVTVVLGHDPGIQNSLARGNEARFVVNPDFELGQLSSLQCGLRAIPAEAEAIVFTPVDYPAVQEATVSVLIRKWSEGREHSSFVIPRFNGRRGHPVLFSASMKAEFLALPPEADARAVIHGNVARTNYVDVDDAGILRDIDDPQAYAELLQTGSGK